MDGQKNSVVHRKWYTIWNQKTHFLLEILKFGTLDCPQNSSVNQKFFGKSALYLSIYRLVFCGNNGGKLTFPWASKAIPDYSE